MMDQFSYESDTVSCFPFFDMPYGSRVTNTEHASFTPLVFTTVAPECDSFHKNLAEIISDKRKERYSHQIKTPWPP